MLISIYLKTSLSQRFRSFSVVESCCLSNLLYYHTTCEIRFMFFMPFPTKHIFFKKSHYSRRFSKRVSWEKPMVFWNGLSGIYISPVPTQFHPVVQLTSFQPSQNPDYTKFHIHVFQFWYIKLKLNMSSLWRTTSKCHWLRHKLLLSKDLMFRHHYWLFSTRVIFLMYNITH